MSTKELIAEACLRMRGLTKLSRDEMRLVGYAEDATEIDVALASNEPHRLDPRIDATRG